MQHDGEVTYIANFLSADQASEYFRRLYTDLNWQQETIMIAGRQQTVPRLVCWYGDAGAVYHYSGTTHYPQPWTAELVELKQKIETLTGWRFNSVLANLYRDGRDSMGWHADNEKALGRNPCIASLSLGQNRRFKLRHNKKIETLDLELASGSLLLMAGSLQHHWRHCLPKSQRIMGPRINLTFRRIIQLAS